MQLASRELFRHVSAERSVHYRCILDVFALAKRQYRLQLRPDEVLAEADWTGTPPRLEEVNALLAQLAEWGNLESQADTSRVSSLSDFYRARYLYRLSHGGEAVEAGLAVFVQTLERRAELQSIALEDIAGRLRELLALAQASELDVNKIHESLRDLVRVFEGLAENAQAFMAGVARSIELQAAEAAAVVTYKRRLIDYLERFMGDLVRRSDTIARHIGELSPRIDTLLRHVAEREARDAAPDDAHDQGDERARRERIWHERWTGVKGWFLSTGTEPPQADLLRARARSAIPQLLGAIAALNERRSGRSDRSADFRVLARWFADCASDEDAHRLARAAFALNPARHFKLNAAAPEDLPASTSWADAPALIVHPRLREYGEAIPRGAPPSIRDRAEARAVLAQQVALSAQHERGELVAVCRTLLELGVLVPVAGDEEGFVHAGGDVADALYDVGRRALSGMLAAVRGPSTWPLEDAPLSIAERLHALVDEHVADSDEARRTAVRHHLSRRLLDDPVIYIDSLDDDARTYFMNQRGALAARLSESAGLGIEQRAEGLALVDESGDLTDIAMPAEGTDAHATLLVADFLATAYRNSRTSSRSDETPNAGRLIREEAVRAFVAGAKDEYGRYWRKSAREPGGEDELTEVALDRLAKLALIARDGSAIRPLPALARFALGAPQAEAARPRKYVQPDLLFGGSEVT